MHIKCNQYSILNRRITKLKNNLLLHCLITLNKIPLFLQRSVLAMSHHFTFLVQLIDITVEFGIQKITIYLQSIKETLQKLKFGQTGSKMESQAPFFPLYLQLLVRHTWIYQRYMQYHNSRMFNASFSSMMELLLTGLWMYKSRLPFSQTLDQTWRPSDMATPFS